MFTNPFGFSIAEVLHPGEDSFHALVRRKGTLFEKPLFAAFNLWVRLQNKKMLCIGHVIYLLC